MQHNKNKAPSVSCYLCKKVLSSKGLHTHYERAHLNNTTYGGGAYTQVSAVAAIKRENRIKEYDVSPNYCKECNSPLKYNVRRNIFCSSSCSAKHANKKRVIPKKTFKCVLCNTVNTRRHNGANKFCNAVCQGEYMWQTKHIPMIESGKKLISGLTALVRYVTERDGYVCSRCNISEWQGEKLSLDLDHIDGNRTNNFPANLRLLCPNCHRLTPTWGNKNR